MLSLSDTMFLFVVDWVVVAVVTVELPLLTSFSSGMPGVGDDAKSSSSTHIKEGFPVAVHASAIMFSRLFVDEDAMLKKTKLVEMPLLNKMGGNLLSISG